MELTSNVGIPFPDQLTPIGIAPNPDIAVRAAVSSEWWPNLRPVLFAGETKDPKMYDDNTKAQLACAFHATIILLILYYLDNRPSPDAPCPPWLFLYGIEYIDSGFKIYAHYPRYEDTKSRWEFTSVLISQAFGQVFESSADPEEKSIKLARAIAALYHIREHCILVDQKLRNWERAPQILKHLTQ
jgi:hypothetical protein